MTTARPVEPRPAPDRLLIRVRLLTILAGLLIQWAPSAAIARLADVLMLAIGGMPARDDADDPGGVLMHCLAEASLLELRRRGSPWREPV